jgi:hypothetical protein
MSFFLSCECNKRTTETQICICRISFPRCFRFRAAFGSPQNALSERTSTLAGFGSSSRHIRSITKIWLVVTTHTHFSKKLREMCLDNAEIAIPSSVSRYSQIFMTNHNCAKFGNQVQNMRFRNQVQKIAHFGHGTAKKGKRFQLDGRGWLSLKDFCRSHARILLLELLEQVSGPFEVVFECGDA